MINRRAFIEASITSAAIFHADLLGQHVECNAPWIGDCRCRDEAPQYEETSESSVASGGGTCLLPRYELIDAIEVQCGERRWWFKKRLGDHEQASKIAKSVHDWLHGLPAASKKLLLIHRCLRLYADGKVQIVDGTPGMIHWRS